MSNALRLFIAVEASEEVRAALGRVQQQLRRDDLPVRWVHPETMHLTLHFLGETEEPRVAAVVTAMQELRGQAPVVLRLGQLGAFPNTRRPNVLWVGVEGDTSALAQMQQRLATALAPLGFPGDNRPFRAHLTLGRVRREATPAQQARLGAALQATTPPAPLTWLATRVVLFRSELLSGGPRYTAHQAVELSTHI